MLRTVSGALMAIAAAAPLTAADGDRARDWEPEANQFFVLRAHDTPRTLERFAATPYAALLATPTGQMMMEETIYDIAEEIGSGDRAAGLAMLTGIHEINWAIQMERHQTRAMPDDPSFQLVLRGPGVPALEQSYIQEVSPTALPLLPARLLRPCTKSATCRPHAWVS